MNEPTASARTSLAERCKVYLQEGPPPEMIDYVPGSILEIILSHGAGTLELDPELREIGSIALEEAETVADGEKSPIVRDYLQRGAALIREVLETRDRRI